MSKRFDITRFSKDYTVRFLQNENIETMLRLCQGNPVYFHFYGSDPSAENLEKDFSNLPPSTSLDKKYFMGIFDERIAYGNNLVAILDIIDGYPDSDTAYIGWFIMDSSLQGCGLGSRIMSHVFEYLKEVGIKKVQLCYMKGNSQARGFWIKNGFLPLEYYPDSYRGDFVREESYKIDMMKVL